MLYKKGIGEMKLSEEGAIQMILDNYLQKKKKGNGTEKVILFCVWKSRG